MGRITTNSTLEDDMASMTCAEDNSDSFKKHQSFQARPSMSSLPSTKRPSPIIPTSSLQALSITSGASPALTPPLTPVKQPDRRASGGISGSSGMDLEETRNLRERLRDEEVLQGKTHTGHCQKQEVTWEETSPQPCTKKFRLRGSKSMGYEEYGRGAWSVVYRAVEITENTLPPSLLTPPSSPTPTNRPALHPTKDLLAVKAPSRRDAHKILYKEARILTYLHTSPQAPTYLVPFHGYAQPDSSFLLTAIPLSLESHTKSAAKTARANFTTRTMFDPVVGTQQWAHIASHLISGLEFLHSRNCIHGDIKPANILLQPSDSSLQGNHFLLTPLYCDFSSSSITTPLSAPEPISAVTTEYTSPELLSSLHHPPSKNNHALAIATPASDIFALAVTLVTAATGESPYEAARLEVQKLSMCLEGRPLEFAAGGEQGTRVRKGGTVWRCLEGAMRRERVGEGMGRWGVEEWKGLVEEKCKERGW